MKKTSFLLAIIIVLLCILVGCQSDPVVSMFIYDTSDTFIVEFANKISQSNRHLQLDSFNANNSQTSQNKQIVRAINNSSAIIVNLVDRVSSGTIIQKAEQNQVPVIFINREPLKIDLLESSICYYVGANPEQQGVMQAHMAYNKLSSDFAYYDRNNDNKIQTIVLKGQPAHQDTEKRTVSSLTTLQALLADTRYRLEIIAMDIANFSRNEAYQLFAEKYSDVYNGAELILSNNDDMALGAIDYMLEKGVFTCKASNEYDQPILVLGVDGTKAGQQAIANGLLYGTVLNDSDNQSLAVSQLLHCLLNNLNVAEYCDYTLVDGKYIYVEGKEILQSTLSTNQQ